MLSPWHGTRRGTHHGDGVAAQCPPKKAAVGWVCCVFLELKAMLSALSSPPSPVDNDTEPALWAVRENKSNHGETQSMGMQSEMHGQGLRFAAASVPFPLKG